MKKLILFSGVLLFLGIMISASLWLRVKNLDISYNKVNVIVSNVEKIEPKNVKEGIRYIIKVYHDGKEKELNNVKMGFSYYVGKSVEVFEKDGLLYEDEAGVRTNTVAATYYFVSLGVNLVLIFLLVYGIVAYRRGR